MVIREMRWEDCESIAQLEAEVFTDAWSKEALAETLRQSHAFIAVAEEGGVQLGYIIVYYVLDEAEIARIAVAPSARHKGVGGRLLQFCEQKCEALGSTTILLDVRESNVPARKFYEKHQFQVDGVRKRFYENPQEDAILMSKREGERRRTEC